jgi:hypothetical protein
MDKFPSYEFEPLPMHVVNKSNTSRLPTADEVYQSEENDRAYAKHINGDDDYGS